jgi:hypothetical protein
MHPEMTYGSRKPVATVHRAIGARVISLLAAHHGAATESREMLGVISKLRRSIYRAL